MSLLVEIATRADVPLEAVVRVLTREPVSDDAKARILTVLDDLDPEQTRVLQRFALAAVHDVLPRPTADMVEEDAIHDVLDGMLEDVVVDDVVEEDVAEEDVAEEDVMEELGEPAPAPAALEAPPAALPAAPANVAPLVQLGPVLSDLADAVRELRRETDAERRERVDDLAVLIDLITKGWEGLDRRLGRLERQLARLEAAEPPRRTLPVAIEPPPVPTPPEPQPPPPPDGNGRSVLRGRLPLVAILGLGIGVGAVAALDLPERSDVSAVVSASTNDATAPRPATGTLRTSSVLGEVATDPPQAPPASRKPAPATTAAATATTTKATTTAESAAPGPADPTTAPPPETGFRPSRNWAWPPAAGADYYLVEFFRAGRIHYRARPTAAQLTLPDSVVFAPGSYRWRVRPGHGAPAANDLDAPIVDSAFTVPG